MCNSQQQNVEAMAKAQQAYALGGQAVYGSGIGSAVSALKDGKRVSRRGWNSPGMWLSLTEGQMVSRDRFWSKHNATFAKYNGGFAEVQSYITMKTVNGTIVPWTCSQTDLLADDWEVLP